MKLHPLTALRDAGAYGTQGGSLGIVAGIVGTATGVLPSAAVVVLVAVGAVVGAAFGVARYAVFRYELGERTLAIRSGVVQRQEREIPLERVQNVDVQQSILQRLFGVAVVRFETAGGGQTEGQLRFVGAEEAASLQSELRRRKRAARGEAEEGAAADEPEPELLFELSRRRLAMLAAVSFRWGVVPLLAFGGPIVDDLLLRVFRRVVVPVLLDGDLSPSNPRLLGVVAGGVAAYLLLTWVVSAAITVVQYHGFRLARVGDELVYERGLLRRYSGTVPLDKVQSLAVEANAPMRALGYAALRIETAGYAPGSGGNGDATAPSAVPLADRAAVLSLAAAIEDVEDLSVERPPRRARRRYVGRYSLVALGLAVPMAAVHTWVIPLGVFWALPALALLAAAPWAHLTWANRGHRTDATHFVTRTGVWRRRTRIVPYYRLQTVLTERSVFQRRWGLASVVGDTAATGFRRGQQATAFDLDLGRARSVHETLRARLQADLRRRAEAADERAARGPVGDAPGEEPDGVGEEGVEDGEESDDGDEGMENGGGGTDDGDVEVEEDGDSTDEEGDGVAAEGGAVGDDGDAVAGGGGTASGVDPERPSEEGAGGDRGP